MARTPRQGFTIVELLVVIAIIVTLISLLAPALDQAIYQGELAVCGSRLHAIGSGVAGYALHHRRQYPHRSAVNEMHRISATPSSQFFGNETFGKVFVDDRPMLREAFPMKVLLCPLARTPVDFDLDPPGSSLNFVSYRMFFGFTFKRSDKPQESMLRMGDRWRWDTTMPDGMLREHRFSVLAGDEDYVNNAQNPEARASHPDRLGVLNLVWIQAGGPLAPGMPFTFSEWLSPNYKRGTLDTHYGFEDGAVQRYNAVAWNDADTEQTVVRVPHWFDGTDWAEPGIGGGWGHAPRP